MSKKKLVFIGAAHPYRGGLSAFNERMCTEFMQNGWEVEIYTFTLQYPDFLFPGKTQYNDAPKPAHLTIYRKVNSVNPFNWIKVGMELRKKAPDLVLVKFWLPFMGPCFGTILRFLNRRKTKAISILDNVIPHEKRIGDKSFTSYFTKAADGFIAMSDKVANDLKKFNTTKPRLTTPHPLFDNFGAAEPREAALKALGLDPEYRYLLFFGFVRDYKGLDLMLDAIANPYFRENNIKLIVAGEYYNNQDIYKEQIDRLGIGDIVLQHDHFINDDQVAHYFCASEMVCQPYKNATQSGVTQIAYHFNTPILVTNVGGLPDMVPDEKVGYVVPVDAVKITEKLISFFEENRREEFVQNIEVEKQKYGWDKMVEKILDIYGKITR